VFTLVSRSLHSALYGVPVWWLLVASWWDLCTRSPLAAQFYQPVCLAFALLVLAGCGGYVSAGLQPPSV